MGCEQCGPGNHGVGDTEVPRGNVELLMARVNCRAVWGQQGDWYAGTFLCGLPWRLCSAGGDPQIFVRLHSSGM